MNIFYLDRDPRVAAMYHHDKHVIKMILECAQLLSTAHRVIDGEQYIDTSSGRKIKRWRLKDDSMESTLYKATHVNHPSAVWARQSVDNYKWLYELFFFLCKEYTHRYDKYHKCEELLLVPLANVPKNIPMCEGTRMPQAMPDEYKDKSSIEAYRNYYRATKLQQSKYTNREKPYWINEA